MNMAVTGVLLLVATIVWVALEVYGGLVRRKKGDTFSEGVWWVRARMPRPVFLTAMVSLIVASGVWLIVHFGWQG